MARPPSIDNDLPAPLKRKPRTPEPGGKQINAIRPDFQIFIYGYLPTNPSDRLPWLFQDEIAELKSPIEFPKRLIERVTFGDHLESADFSITIPAGMRQEFDTELASGLRLAEIVDEGTIIAIFEGGLSVFVGYVMEISDSGSADANDSLVITGAGIESIFKAMTLFIDFDPKKEENKTKEQIEASNQSAQLSASDSFSKAVLSFFEVIKRKDGFDPPGIVKGFAGAAINNLLSTGLYGGSRFADILDVEKYVSNDSYTKSFVHVINIIQSASWGNQINYWNIINSFVKPPLYEIFVHYNSHDKLYVDGSTTIPANDETEQTLAFLVFRKTPFKFLKPDGSGLPESHPLVCGTSPSWFSGYTLKSGLNDIFSGVHVSPAIIDNMAASLFLNQVTYSPSLLQKHGQRVLPVHLDGVQFPPTSGSSPRSDLVQKLKDVQQLLFDTFGNGDRIVSGTLAGTYNRYVTKGKILQFPTPLPKGLQKYDSEFYITGRSVTFYPATGEATMNVNVKWARRASRGQRSQPASESPRAGLT